jgi:pimeloyl-ACP methyl ester carboxylesterase
MNIPHNIPAPSKFWLVAEPRAIVESFSLAFNKKTLKNAPKGNGAPVMVLPGLGTSDLSTAPLRQFLKQLGYTPYGWGMGINKGYKASYEETLLRKLRHLYLKHDQKVKLVGWSMGGIYARELAKMNPHVTSQVITMGSPFSGGKTQNTNVNALYRLLNGQKIRATHDSRANFLHEAPPVPSTAIYSKTDGIVCWQYCIEYGDFEHLESIEVKGSHVGLGFNSMVWTIVADRLAQDPNNWKSFDNHLLEKAEHPVLV